MTRHGCGIVFAALALAAHATVAAVQTATVRVNVPDYQVSRQAGLDEVSIPGGQLLATEPGRPIVPYYTGRFEYPAGTRIQDVELTSRQGLRTDSGLRLPAVSEDTIAVDFEEMIPGAYPKQEFTWTQLDDADKTVLLLYVFPFSYDPKATTVEFCNQYEFKVRSLQTGVSVVSLDLEPPACDPGDSVTVRVVLANSGTPTDIRVLGTVQRGAEILLSLPAHDVAGLGPADTVNLRLATKRLPAGVHLFQAVVADRDGSELARSGEPFQVGVPQCEVTSFSVEPEVFKVGDDIRLTLDCKNTGSTGIAGECVFRITESGRVLDEMIESVTTLKPGQKRSFSKAWSTDSARKDAVYHAVGFVRYEGTACGYREVVFSTNRMPTASFTVARDTVAAGEEVAFDASGSNDPDGEVVAYRWDFGDGGKAEGVEATHVYPEPGEFVVTLVATDDGGRAASAEKTILVGE